MELVLKRSYHSEGTNGELWYRGLLIGYTIEPPWLQNQPGISCIPEGRYRLTMQYIEGYGWQIHISGGPAQPGMPFRAANSILEMGTGCIAPVSQLLGQGHGIASDFAVRRLEGLVFEAFNRVKNIFITIKKKIS